MVMADIIQGEFFVYTKVSCTYLHYKSLPPCLLAPPPTYLSPPPSTPHTTPHLPNNTLPLQLPLLLTPHTLHPLTYLPPNYSFPT